MKLIVRRQLSTTGVSLFLYDKSEDGRLLTTYTIKKGALVPHRIEIKDPGMAIDWDPVFTTNEETFREIIQQVANYAQEEGIPLPDENFSKGKLEAQTEHLKDLRILLKL